MLAETNAVAMARPYTKPVQPACTSNAPARVAPILSATIDAVAGMMWSGEIVVTITRSSDSGSQAHDSRQRVAATSPEVARRLVDAARCDARVCRCAW